MLRLLSQKIHITKIFCYVALLLNIFILSHSAHASLCSKAIHNVAPKISVPEDVVMAVALTETGTKRSGRLAPYPWAINVEGRGFLFPTKKKAIKAVRKYLKQGKKSIDIGCMQLNWRWHGQKFGYSIEKAFDPTTNITVGAKYIREHYYKYKNWHKAAGRYHSGTSKHAKRYQRRYLKNLKIAKAQLGQKGTYVGKSYASTIPKPKPRKKKRYPTYKLAMLNKAPGSLLKYQDTDPIKPKYKPYKPSPSIFGALDSLPKAPKPILDTARKRHLFKR